MSEHKTAHGARVDGFKRPRELTAAWCRTVKRPGKYGDGHGGHGLSLLVRALDRGGVSRTWLQRIRIAGRITNLGFGPLSLVSLAEARTQARTNARDVRAGRDPRAARVPTVAAAVERTIALLAPSWKDPEAHAKAWRGSLEKHALPRLGSLLVSAVTPADVLAALAPIWTTKHETARLIRQRLGAVMKWAISQGYRGDNPAGDAIGALLPRRSAPREHRKALPHADVSGAIRRVRESAAPLSVRLAFEFLVMTAARSGEVRGARWGEVDTDAAVWTIPAGRMKAKREHRVPLSDAALDVLARARELTDGDDGLIFPSATGREMQDFVLSRLCRSTGIAAVPHGFRSSFRDWCGDTGRAREVAEAALAHAVGNQVEAAYFRSDLFDRRRVLMTAWAEYLQGGQSAKVIRFA